MNVNAVFQDLCNESTNMREYSIRSQNPAGLLKYSHLLCAMMNGLLDKSLKVEVVPGSAFFMALVITRAQYGRIPNDFIKTAKKSFGARVGISQPDPDDDKRPNQHIEAATSSKMLAYPPKDAYAIARAR